MADNEQWERKLTPTQRHVLGLPDDAELLVRPPGGLDEIEERLRTKYQALVESSGPQPITLQQMRQLLAGLAHEFARGPGGGHVGKVMMPIDGIADKLELGPVRDAFVQIGVATGVLDQIRNHIGFVDSKTLDYFTSIGLNAS